MGPPNHTASGKLRKIYAVAEFARDLQSKLPGCRDVKTIDLLLADIGHQVQVIRDLAQQAGNGKVPNQAAKDVERQGRSLWNLCLQLKRNREIVALPDEQLKLLIRTRVLAFLMLELGREAGTRKKDQETEVVYLLNLALTLGRLCIGDADLDSARLALQKAAEYVERLTAITCDPSDATGDRSRRKLKTEYLAMRMALSWKEDRLDVAEHMFSKTDLLRQGLDVPSAELIADTLHHIGFDLASKGEEAMAVKWLKRAHKTINLQPLDQLSAQGLELRLAIVQGLVQGLLTIGSTECIQDAGNLVAYAESEIGDKPIILHWRLELLQKTSKELFDVEACCSILHRMIQSFDYTDGTFHFLLHHIKEFMGRSYRLSYGLFDELLFQHVLPSKKVEWINKMIVRRIWMSTTDMKSTDVSTDLEGLLHQAHEISSESLDPDVAGAAHALIWKKVEALLVKKDYESTETWCSIALGEIFSSSGESNRGKFGRKLIICALGLNQVEKAQSAFYSMSEASQNHILTRYLMFKASLLNWDHQLGCQSIDFLSKAADKTQSRDILYACIREAQQVGDKLCTLAALQAVAESWTVGKVSACNLTSILRCGIRLLHHISEQSDTASNSGMANPTHPEDICKLFEKASEHAQQDPRDDDGNKVFTIAELHWFRKNAYNIGARNCGTWELPHIIRILHTCLVFRDCYPKDLPLPDTTEMTLMAMRCHFVIASALVSLARAEDRTDEQLQRYLEARHHVEAFDAVLQTDAGPQNQEILADLLTKLSTLFVFDFEAAAYLKDWDSLAQIVRKGTICRDEVMYKAMGDCLLRSQAPGKVMFNTMKLLINEIFELQEFDHNKLAKYIRCMFQAILGNDDDSALQLLDQALQIARESRQASKQFPPIELEWLIATSFNHSIDFYARGDEEGCHRWALKAIDLAEYLNDGGLLRETLQAKFAKLRFENAPARQLW